MVISIVWQEMGKRYGQKGFPSYFHPRISGSQRYGQKARDEPERRWHSLENGEGLISQHFSKMFLRQRYLLGGLGGPDVMIFKSQQRELGVWFVGKAFPMESRNGCGSKSSTFIASLYRKQRQICARTRIPILSQTPTMSSRTMGHVL